MRQPCPTETEEEVTLSNYCDAQHWVHWHVPQETYTTSWKQKAKNKAQGVLEGVSDHWVILPTCKGHLLVVIELKRQWGNTPTDAQIKFLNDIDAVTNVVPVCCYGADEAIQVLKELREYKTSALDKCLERTEKLRKKRENPSKKPRKLVKTSQNAKNILPY